jgi:Isochorismatase family
MPGSRFAPRRRLLWAAVLVAGPLVLAVTRGREAPPRAYVNRLTPIEDPAPLLADHPEFVEPLRGSARFGAPPLIDEEGADLLVRAWRYSYHARGIVEVESRLRADRTALIVVHPWGIDDGQGWRTPEPAGAAFQCTPDKNRLYRRHLSEVVAPFVARLRGRVRLVVYSLPGARDRLRAQLYRSLDGRPAARERDEARDLLARRLADFAYQGEPLPAVLELPAERPLAEYFRQFPGLDAGTGFNPEGFWSLPVPLARELAADPDDVVVYDREGYPALRRALERRGVQHVLLAGYNVDDCVRSTTAGYENLRADFDVFLVGDATLATFPASATPAACTTAALVHASLGLFVTEVGWVRVAGAP